MDSRRISDCGFVERRKILDKDSLKRRTKEFAKGVSNFAGNCLTIEKAD
jgi:hypothetical protein